MQKSPRIAEISTKVVEGYFFMFTLYMVNFLMLSMVYMSSVNYMLMTLNCIHATV